MPLYDYRCHACEHQFEELQAVGDPPLETCPNCGQSSLKKLVSAPSFAFKGSGWYKDLYGAPPPKKQNKDEAKKSATKPAESGAKSESKTAAKTG